MNAAEKWGLPNWQDASVYPAPDDLTTLEWWWEFTRRRSDYRDLWDGAKRGITVDGLRAAPDVDVSRVKFQMSRLLDPSKTYPEWTIIQVCHPTNYGMEPEPSHIFDDLDNPISRAAVGWRNKKEELAQEAGHYRFNFDLNLPLQPQLDRAKQYLEIRQAHLKGKVLRDTNMKNGRHRWPEYLRVLDAKECGAGPSEIKRTLWPDDEAKRPSSADAAHKQARHIQNNFPL